MNLINARIAIICAHMDDEVLGCGGILARRKHCGKMAADVLVLSESCGSRGEQGAYPERVNAMNHAAALLNYVPVLKGNFPDNQMDTVPLLRICQTVEEYLRAVQPEIVITHHGGDLNIDHRRVYEAVKTALRPGKFPSVQALLTMEVLSSTECGLEPFQPNVFISLDAEDVVAKADVMACYSTEMAEPRTGDSIAMLAHRRANDVGDWNGYAEAFHLEFLRD